MPAELTGVCVVELTRLWCLCCRADEVVVFALWS